MPVRRRAPKGCRLSGLQVPILSYGMFRNPESRQQNVKLFLREPLARFVSVNPRSCGTAVLFFRNLTISDRSGR